MADIKYVSELNFKRGLKGVIDWIKSRYIKSEITTNGGGYPLSVKFHYEPDVGDGGYIQFGETSAGKVFIRSESEGPGTVYYDTLAKESDLTEWYWSAANPAQNTLTTFRLTGPKEEANNIPTISFVDTDSNTLTFTADNNYAQNEVKIEKSIPTKQYVDGTFVKTIKVNGTALTPDSNKAVDVDVPVFSGSGKGQPGMGTEECVNVKIANRENSDYIAVNFTDNGLNLTGSIYDDAIAGGTNCASTRIIPDETRVNALITAGLGSISGVNFQVVQTLPATGVNGVFYLIANPTASGSNIYDEYVWVNKGTPETPDYAFERLGTMDVDLTDYTKESDFTALSNDEVDAILVEIGVKTATPTP